MKRFAYTIFLITCIFFFPWWVVFVFGFFGAIRFSSYFEVILVGITYDWIFHSSLLPWYQSGWHVLIAVGIFLISILLGKVIRK